MILRILVIVFICILIVFVGYWIWTGGISRGINYAKGIDNPLGYFFSSSTLGSSIKLPGQPDSSGFGVDITQYMDSVGSADGSYGYGSTYNGQGGTNQQQQELSELQERYDALYAQANDAKNFGNPSPYRGKIIFGSNTAQESTTAGEYITIQADYQNTAPISLTGWTLQSAVTGVRAALPMAAPVFVQGVVNSVTPVNLDPGNTAVVVSGASPIGVSFRENICTGYLAELQTFVPELDRACPRGEDEIPLNAQNIQNYGDTCIDLAKNMQQCHFPGLDTPTNVSPACNNFISSRLSYNGCVYAHRNDRTFATNKWHLYLTSGVPLWRDTHDIVRLLDDQGRTVDVLTY